MGDDYEVLNDWGGIRSTLRTRTSGKSRVTIDVKAEALVINTDPRYWVETVAESIAVAFRTAISNIATPAAEATEDARKVAANAYSKGKRWAMKRYAGGRIGPMAPRQSRKLLDDSGRLIKSIVARFATKTDIAGTAVINVAANRLDEPVVRGRVFAIMQAHIPWLRDPSKLAQEPVVMAAMRGVVKGAVQKAKDASTETLKRALELGRTIADVGNTIGEAARQDDEG